MSAELIVTCLFLLVLAYILAPYWWRAGWWRIPHDDMARPLRERITAIERQIADLEFDAATGKMTTTDLETNTARRALERDRLVQQLARLGGMAAVRPLPPPIRHERRCEDCGSVCPAGSRFCAECGVPLKPRPLPPASGAGAKLARRKIIRLHGMVTMLLIACLTLLGPGDLFALGLGDPSKGVPPHEAMATGVIEGVLWRGDNIVRDHAYDIVVRLGPRDVVRVQRHTDATGHFIIKNIFPHEALHYFLEVHHQGRVLSSAPLQLSPGVAHAELDVTVSDAGGQQPPRLAGAGMNRPPVEMATAAPSGDATPFGAPQWTSLVLCAVVIVGNVVQWGWSRRRRMRV